MRKAITQRRTNCRARCFRETGLRNDLNSGSASCMISTGGSFFSGWRMVRFLTTILPKSAERRKPPFEPTHVEKAQLQKSDRWGILRVSYPFLRPKQGVRFTFHTGSKLPKRRAETLPVHTSHEPHLLACQ